MSLGAHPKLTVVNDDDSVCVGWAYGTKHQSFFVRFFSLEEAVKWLSSLDIDSYAALVGDQYDTVLVEETAASIADTVKAQTLRELTPVQWVAVTSGLFRGMAKTHLLVYCETVAKVCEVSPLDVYRSIVFSFSGDTEEGFSALVYSGQALSDAD